MTEQYVLFVGGKWNGKGQVLDTDCYTVIVPHDPGNTIQELSDDKSLSDEYVVWTTYLGPIAILEGHKVTSEKVSLLNNDLDNVLDRSIHFMSLDRRPDRTTATAWFIEKGKQDD